MVTKWSREEKKGVFEMMCLRFICDIRRVDRLRNSPIRERSGCELSVLETIERNVLMVRACGKNGGG